MAGEKNIKVRFSGDAAGLGKAAAQGERELGKFAKGFDRMRAGVTKGAAAVGLAAGAALTAGVAAGLEQSKASALLNAQLGASGPAAANIGAATGKVFGRGVVASIDEASAAVKAAVQNALVPKDASVGAIDAVASKIANLSAVLESDAATVSAAVSQMLRTGVAKSAQEAFDILAKGAANGANKAGDLLDTFNEYGVQFRKLGLEGPASLGLISQGLQAGARDADVVADALKEFSIRAVDGSKSTADGFKALGLSGTQMAAAIAGGGPKASAALDTVLDRLRAVKDPVKQAQIGVQLFGTQAEDLGRALFALDPSTAAAGLGQLGGAADRASKTLEESAGARLDAFKNKVQSALVDKLAQAVPYIDATFGWLSKNSAWVEPLATALGILAVAIGVMVAVQWAWNAALALSPVTWIVLGIVALIAIIAVVATKTRFFQTIWGAVWGFFKAIGSWFAGPFAGFFVAVWSKIASGAKWVWDKVAAYFGFWFGLFEKVKGWLGAAHQWMIGKFTALVAFIGGLPGRISSAASGMWNGIKDSFRNALNWIIDKWNGLSFTLPSINVPGLGKIGGYTLNTPDIGRLASGGHMTPGRTYLTGENGPELLTAGRRGGYVHPASDTAAMLGPPEVRVYIGDRELLDIVDVQIDRSNRQLKRRTGVRA